MPIEIDIPRPVQYALNLEAADDEAISALRNEPAYLLPTLPYPGLVIMGVYADYEIVGNPRVEPQRFAEEPKEYLEVYVQVKIHDEH